MLFGKEKSMQGHHVGAAPGFWPKFLTELAIQKITQMAVIWADGVKI